MTRDAGLSGPVEITPAEVPGTAWTVAQIDNTWPVQLGETPPLIVAHSLRGTETQ
ncbi:hypothetical protein ABZ807_27995 [Micromonospora sp. NPDC047548]|uniref:hypothetical protein n=1 Tax=Micromonospora sp. NPDC047548 TaxID=3155624 RepID=UPI0033EE0486